MANNYIRSTAQTTSKSFPIFAILGCVLIVLKLMHLIDISWIWVFAPFWIPWTIFATVCAGIFIGFVGLLLVALIFG